MGLVFVGRRLEVASFRWHWAVWMIRRIWRRYGDKLTEIVGIAIFNPVLEVELVDGFAVELAVAF